MTQEWLSIVEYARAFDVSDMTIRRRIKTGKLKAVLKDGKYYIPVDDSRSDLSNHMSAQAMNSNVVSPHTNNNHLSSQFAAQQPPVTQQIASSSNLYSSSAPQQINTQSRQRSAGPASALIHQTQSMPNYRHVPHSLAEPILANGVSSVASEDLLSMVDAFMDKVVKNEDEVSTKFKNKVQMLEQSVKSKDSEIETSKSTPRLFPVISIK